MSAELSASPVSRAGGPESVRALQRVLYRSAKHEPERRFHALFDKVARGDVLWRAWLEVRANRGAPGVDGIAVDAIEASGDAGVRAFLDELAAQLRTGRYRPGPLRRVHISASTRSADRCATGVRMPRDEGCRRAVCGRTARTVRCGGGRRHEASRQARAAR